MVAPGIFLNGRLGLWHLCKSYRAILDSHCFLQDTKLELLNLYIPRDHCNSNYVCMYTLALQITKELKKKGDHFILRGDSGQAWGAVSLLHGFHLRLKIRSSVVFVSRG